MKPLQKAPHSVGFPSFFTSARLRVTMLAAVAALGLAAIAPAADYNWTGLGDGHSWSDADNWTNAAGVAVAPAVTDNAKYSYHFPVDDSGLAVTQDMRGAIIISTLTFERTSTAPVTVEMSSKELDCVLYCGSQSSVTVPEGMTLLWKADANRWNNQDVTKNGPGKVIFDYLRSPQTQRGFVLNEGTVEVAATSADPKFHVKMGGSDLANPPVFINRKDGAVVGGLDVLRNGGTVELNGTTLHVGANAQMTGSTNNLPTVVADGGTLAFQNERVAKLSEKTPSFHIALDRADVVAPDFNAASILWTFDDADDPTKDTVGSGSRMVKSGSLSVVEDATRGSVLSFTGGAYLKGPDADNWLDGFEPTKGFTVAFWLKPDANCNNAAKILFWGQNAGDRALAMRLNTTSGKNLMVTTWNGNQEIPITTLRDGNWHHIAVTYTGLKTGENIAVYYDGANIHSFARPAYNPLKKDLYIGNMAGTAWGGNASGTPYTGLMDDFVLVHRAFSAKEVARLAANGVAGVFGKTELGDVAAESAGVLAVESGDVSLKTLSGKAFAGGVEMLKADSTLAVGANAGAAATAFRGVIGGEESTFVKKGADYTLSLSGAAKGVTNVVVEAGTLALNRPLARRGLVFRCSFDNAGDIAHDSSPGGMALEITNAVPVTAVAGVSGTAGHFPGSGAFIGSGSSCLPSCLPRGNDSYTISAWIKPTAAACTGTVPICSWGHPDNYRLVMLRFNGEGKIMYSNYGADHGVSGLSDLTDGNWHHIVATYDGSTRKKLLYYDGVKKLDTTLGANLNVGKGNYPFELGHATMIGSRLNQFYTGDMDEFMVFNYAWDADEVAAEFNRTAAPANVAVEPFLPEPVAHWTFDGADPLAAESGEAALKLSASNGEVTFESGDAICGKAARFTNTSGFLTLDTFPADIIPTGNPDCTIVIRYRPDQTQLQGNIYPSVVGWGNDGGWSDGTLVRIGVGSEDSFSVRGLLRGTTMEADGMRRTSLGTDRTRWCTVALVFQTPALRDNRNVTAWLIVDGEIKKSSRLWNDMALPAQDFCIGSNAEGSKTFRGLVDDVQIYNRVLSAGQVRMIAEQFEASKGQATTGTAIPAGVLAAQPDVAVASGATLRVESTETIGNLSGAGDVEIASLARLNLAGTSGFEGAVTGDGVVGIADGATLEFGDGTSPLFGIDCALAIGENVTVHTTVRTGRLLLAEAESFTDAENLSSWTATVPAGVQAHFVLSSDGKKLYLSMPQGLVIYFQ